MIVNNRRLRSGKPLGIRLPDMPWASGFRITNLSCAVEATEHAVYTPIGQTLSSWVFATPEGNPYSSDNVKGRTTIVLFLTTYDTASQIAATRLENEIHQLSRRVNAIGVALEPPNHSILVGVFHDSLHLSYPLLMPDPATLAGHGPFGAIEVVPTWVILDQSGREIWRGAGVSAVPELQATLRRLGAGSDE